MSCLGMFRRMSNAFACLSVRQGRGGHSTDRRRQDKSRGVRLGRSVEEVGTDQRLAHEVPCPPQPAHSENPLKIIARRTSHGERP
jgi:hypothetical protein